MSLPVVAVVGRPNVGKSTFVNRIAQADDAIVHEMRGVTRDRSYHAAEWSGVSFNLIDTGGIEMNKDDAFQSSIRDQAFMGANEADAIVFLVDARTGIQTDDEEVARILRKSNKPLFLCVNKMDNPADDSLMWEFMSLGLGQPWPISATHGHGTGDLLDAIIATFADRIEDNSGDNIHSIRVALIGRPNAGKSSLTNKLLGTNRSIVSDVAGTTRDAIDTSIEHNGTLYTLVDTAGLRRKANIDEDVEDYGFVRAMRAIDSADVALLVIDATVGLTDQDQRVAGYAAERGCALVILLNKRDAVESGEVLEELRDDIKERLTYVNYAPVISISALTGKGVERIWAAIDDVYDHYNAHISTPRLNGWLEEIREFGHTVSKGKKTLRLKYITQTHTAPPQFSIFCNMPELVTDNFERYLENRLRQKFDLTGTPVSFKFKRRG